MNNDTPSNNAKPRGSADKSWRWPLAVVAILSLHATMWISFVFISTRDPSFAVEPDYYRKSLAWDETVRQRRANEALGWSVEIETEKQTGMLGDRGLVCRVKDRDGSPIVRAAVEAEIFHHARANQRLRVQLTGEGGGVYSARPRMRKPGLWECRLTVRDRGATFTCVIMHKVLSSGRRSA